MTEILEGLNVFRALEAWGAVLYARWAEHETDVQLRTGHLIIAEREANHARLLAERIRALGGEPGPACVDDVLAAQLTELCDVRGLVAQLDALKAVNVRDAKRLEPCQSALRRGYDTAKASDHATAQFLAQLYSEEKVSGGWYREMYSQRSGKRDRTDVLPILDPEQVCRRAESVTFMVGEPAACLAAS